MESKKQTVTLKQPTTFCTHCIESHSLQCNKNTRVQLLPDSGNLDSIASGEKLYWRIKYYIYDHHGAAAFYVPVMARCRRNCAMAGLVALEF